MSDKTQMKQRPSYLAGVERAKKERTSRQKRITDNYDNIVAFVSKRDVAASKQAKEHADKRRERYGEKASNVVRFIVVPKGSKPLRITPKGTTRREFRKALRKAMKREAV